MRTVRGSPVDGTGGSCAQSNTSSLLTPRTVLDRSLSLDVGIPINNDKIHGLIGSFFGLCSLSPLGGKSVLRSLSLAVGIGSAIGGCAAKSEPFPGRNSDVESDPEDSGHEVLPERVFAALAECLTRGSREPSTIKTGLSGGKTVAQMRLAALGGASER